MEKKKKDLAGFESKYNIRIWKGDGEMKGESKKEGNAQLHPRWPCRIGLIAVGGNMLLYILLIVLFNIYVGGAC